MDYGRSLEFGYFLIPDAADPRGVLQTARLADRLGYDLLAVQDHPYQPAQLDTLALLGAILGQTEQIRVFQDVANLPLRPPAVFAKAAATLDVLSGGRFEAGVGGGGFLRAAQAMGAPPLSVGESLVALEEAVAILRASWSGAPGLRFEGRHYRLEGARPDPLPEHDIGIWLGAAKPRALALTGRVADGWAAPLMNYMPPAAAGEAQTLNGDYECPYSRAAFRAIERVERELGEGVRFAFRHFPLTEIHPHALAASAAAEAAALQGRFWELHELLFRRQRALEDAELRGYAAELGLDLDGFDADRAGAGVLARIRRDVESGLATGEVLGTPTLFIDGVVHRGSYDAASLLEEVTVS